MTPKKSTGKSSKRELRIRMYDVGFGDCFMLLIPTPTGVRKVLFDCGTLKAGNEPLNAVVKRVIAAAAEDGGNSPKIDVIVATHRHKDHVSGFASEAWDEVNVGEVWMPWTEDPEDPDAARIREAQSRLAASLMMRLDSRLKTSGQRAERPRLELARELCLNALSNEAAMNRLHQGFAGDPVRRFLPDKSAQFPRFKTPHLPGVTVHALGPSWKESVIKQMNPPAGEHYLRLAESRDSMEETNRGPFRDSWKMRTRTLKSRWYDLFAALSDGDREVVRAIGSDDEFPLSATVDQAVNGTSLMLAFQIGEATLLFPGDAQWGTWSVALQDQDAVKLLTETTFYKIGHHGSENATPVTFVENIMQGDIWAMVSTLQTGNWPNIPKKQLLDALKKKTAKIARSDKPGAAQKPEFVVLEGGTIEARLPF